MEKPNIEVKICGIKDKRSLSAAIKYDADYIGFMFVEDSPRYIEPEKAKTLVEAESEDLRPAGRKLVAVMADPSDKDLADVLSNFQPDIIQLHGNETRERVREIAGVYDIRLMKALPVSNKKDVEAAKDWIGYADMLLFDAKSPDGQHGGKGKTFDWKLLDHLDIKMPWFLSGGLTIDNVAEAIEITGAKRVDVSSGVEKERGEKDVVMMRQFIKTAKSAD